MRGASPILIAGIMFLSCFYSLHPSPCGCLVVGISAAKSAKCPSVSELIVGTMEQGILSGKSISKRCRKTLSCSGSGAFWVIRQMIPKVYGTQHVLIQRISSPRIFNPLSVTTILRNLQEASRLCSFWSFWFLFRKIMKHSFKKKFPENILWGHNAERVQL